jgi:DNA-binding Lrp family transcriptional regulator
MLRVEKARVADWQGQIRSITKQLDQTNIRILSAMWKFGPRNLLEVSRRTRIPFTSVYHRVGKLEAKTARVAHLVPKMSRLGMVQMTVLLAATPGMENKVTAALKVPGMWRSIMPCEAPFTHHSVHAVPVNFAKDLRKYLARLSSTKLVTNQRVITTGDYVPNFPNFSYYNSASKEWRFEWESWLASLKKMRATAAIDDPDGYPMVADKKDLLIVEELEKNARASFAAMSPILGISLQGVKYHYDKKLAPSGVVQHFELQVTPYPPELSAYHEARLDFSNKLAMNKFFSLLGELFFVSGATKILRTDSLLVRTCIPQTQLQSMFEFFSEMVKTRILESYSAVRLNMMKRETRRAPYELFDEKNGWTFDLRSCTSRLSKLRSQNR